MTKGFDRYLPSKIFVRLLFLIIEHHFYFVNQTTCSDFFIYTKRDIESFYVINSFIAIISTNTTISTFCGSLCDSGRKPFNCCFDEMFALCH